MANIKSAQKQARKAEKRRAINLDRKTSLKTAIKKLLVAIDKKESKDALVALFNDAQAQLARAKSKGLIHANTAARKTSRLACRVAQVNK